MRERISQPAVLNRIINQLKHELSRTGSIVSVFGDAIVPHGGSVWLGTLEAEIGTTGLLRYRDRLSRLPIRTS
jgi:hypothetical protein